MSRLSSLSTRERVLLGAMLVLGAGAAVYSYVIVPNAQARTAALVEIDRYERTSQAIAAAGPTARRVVDTRPVPAIVAQSARDSDIPIRRLEPEGALTRVVLADVGFDILMTWLAALDADHGVTVASIEMDRRPEPGIVTARLVLER